MNSVSAPPPPGTAGATPATLERWLTGPRFGGLPARAAGQLTPARSVASESGTFTKYGGN